MHAYGLNAIDDSYLVSVEDTILTIDEELKTIRELVKYTKMPKSRAMEIMDITLRREINLLRIFMNNTVMQLISLVATKLADNKKIVEQGAKLKKILAEQDKESKERIKKYVV